MVVSVSHTKIIAIIVARVKNMDSILQKKSIATASILICVDPLGHQRSNPALSIQDSIAYWIESAISWVRDKRYAGEAIAGLLRDILEKSAPTAQVTSAALSSECNQVSWLTSRTAIASR